jgi:putative endonuclease
MTVVRKQLGSAGERIAARYYVEQGFEVLGMNWRVTGGEIDLIVCQRRQSLIVFCEVKTRHGDRFGTGLDAVTPEKQRRVRTLAYQWLLIDAERSWAQVRFDVVALDASTRPVDLRIVEGAF